VIASKSSFAETGAAPEMEPSLLEIMSNLQHSFQNGAEECCKCPKKSKK